MACSSACQRPRLLRNGSFRQLPYESTLVTMEDIVGTLSELDREAAAGGQTARYMNRKSSGGWDAGRAFCLLLDMKHI